MVLWNCAKEYGGCCSSCHLLVPPGGHTMPCAKALQAGPLKTVQRVQFL